MLDSQLKTTSLPPLISWTDVATLALTLLVLTFGLSTYAFYEPHEGHFGGVAREMLLRGDWVTPSLNGAPYLNKPPLLYWLSATSTAVFGFNEYAARLPLALSGWLGTVVAWKWARELWGPRAGRVAALMLCVSVGWFLFTHQLLIDVLLSTLLLASGYCLWRLAWEPRCWRYFLALYLLLGLSLLAKGPFGVVFPVLGGLGLSLSRRSCELLKQLRLAWGALVSLAVALPWVVAVERANPGFLDYFLLNENLKRVADLRWPPDYAVSKVSALGYLAVAAVWCVPWTLLLPQVAVSAWQDWRQGCNSPHREDQRRSEGILLLAIAAIAPIVLFLPLSSRLVYYSLPTLPPFVLLCAGWWSRYQKPGKRWGQPVAAVGFGLLGLSSGSAVFWAPALIQQLPELAATPTASAIVTPIALALMLGCLSGSGLLLVKRSRLALVGLLLGLMATWANVTHGLVVIEDIRSAKTLIEQVNPRLGLTTLWTFEGSRELGAAGAMSYYLDRVGNHRLAQLPSALTADPELPGWAHGKAGTVYRTVLVLSDSGLSRILPQFPGPPPQYRLSRSQLQAHWDSERPVVFVTDFLRPSQESLTLNLPRSAGEPLLVVGPRQLYGNAAARELWHRS